MVELVYVDEQLAQANKVLRSAVASQHFVEEEVVHVKPAPSVSETIELILAHQCKVLITDYRLSEFDADVQFTGADLVRKFRTRFEEFPCFLTTAYIGEAVDDALDTNMMFPKSDFLGGDHDTEHTSQLPFFLRVRKKIIEYESFVSNTIQEWEQLTRKNEESLSAEEAERLIKLDSLVEGFDGGHFAVAGHLKSSQALDPFNRLIIKAETLIKKIERDIDSAP